MSVVGRGVVGGWVVEILIVVEAVCLMPDASCLLIWCGSVFGTSTPLS